MLENKKTLHELMAEASVGSPLKKLSKQQAAVHVVNQLKKGVPTGKVTTGAFKKDHETWNAGMRGDTPWAQTRKAKGKVLKKTDPEAYKKYFGVKEAHAPSTKKKMSKTATERWSNDKARLEHSKRLKGIKKETATCKFCGKTMSKANFKKYGHDTGTNKCKGKKSKSTI
jgi:hypothetical protein